MRIIICFLLCFWTPSTTLGKNLPSSVRVYKSKDKKKKTYRKTKRSTRRYYRKRSPQKRARPIRYSSKTQKKTQKKRTCNNVCKFNKAKLIWINEVIYQNIK